MSPEEELRVRELAYFIWEQDQRSEGRNQEHWLRAQEALKGRHYPASPLPLLPNDQPPEVAREVRLKLYAEVCSAWRMLTDVRFKLLGAVPAVTGAALYGVFALNVSGPGTTRAARGLACLVGLAVTFGLTIYNLRNDGLYDDLISRGRRIERELGIHTGLFLGRKTPEWWLVQHSVATWLIYGAALVAWIASSMYFLAVATV